MILQSCIDKIHMDKDLSWW